MSNISSTVNCAEQGFTLVELVIVIVILGILAMVAVPRFQDSSGYAEYALQKRVVTAMRNYQIRAMQDSRANTCYRMVFNTSLTEPGFGPALYTPNASDPSLRCTSTIDPNSASYLRTENAEMAGQGLRLSAQDGNQNIAFIGFNALGQPNTAVANCASQCRISITGQDSVAVCVGSQGYVYAC